MTRTAREIRESIESNWKEYLSRYANLFSSNAVSGSSPPSVFVGSYNYPKVFVGPMVPPIHGDTSLLDIPEKWSGKTLEEIVNFRLNLIRGIKKMSVADPQGRYIEDLQEVAMSSRPIESDIEFHKNTIPMTSIDGESAPFGPIGEIKNSKFSSSSSDRFIQKAYYDRDLKAEDAVLALYNRGIEISKIQKCFSIGMFGKKRKLVPTRWSITATDDIISKSLVSEILDFSLTDACQVFCFEHLDNLYSVVIFPHRWMFEMQEAWHDGDAVGFGNDFEDARGIDHPPAIAGAYFAAKLAIAEYFVKNQTQGAVLVLREIRPEYAVPVGVWQVREGVRATMKQKPYVASSFDDAIDFACKNMSISKTEWLSKGNMLKLIKQKTIADFF
ncbi:MAG: hypothetical protein Q8O65_03135 [Nitrosopumilaceae archaeon]|nr:hypothetical protein [Nitrosopumilaceae archaeon]